MKTWVCGLLLSIFPSVCLGQKASAQRIYSKIQPMVFKIKTAPSATSPQASYGTGFSVARNGLLITNYHVISDSLLNPKQNRIFLNVDGENIPARVLAIDILQDLALVKVDQEFKKWLRFAKARPRQGEVIFSIGQPEDLNMAIVSGTYNGELNFGKYSVIHMSTPINSGMSGGPTVNNQNEIVGINVAKSSHGDSLSFSVPGRFGARLLESGANQDNVPVKKIWEDAEKQILELQEMLTKDFGDRSKKKATMAPWELAGHSSWMKCWSTKEDEREKKYFSVTQVCPLAQSAFISSNARTGYYYVGTEAISNRGLNKWQFFRLLHNRFNHRMNFTDVDSDDASPIWTKSSCLADLYVNKHGIPFKISYCARAYLRFPKLRDARIMYATLKDPPHAIQGAVDLRGFTSENIKKILHTFLDSARLVEE